MTTVRNGGEQRKVEGNEDTGREMTLVFLPSSEQGLLCPQKPLGFLSLNRGAEETQGGVVCLGLGCDGKQEVPVISQEGLTV